MRSARCQTNRRKDPRRSQLRATRNPLSTKNPSTARLPTSVAPTSGWCPKPRYVVWTTATVSARARRRTSSALCRGSKAVASVRPRDGEACRAAGTRSVERVPVRPVAVGLVRVVT